LDGFRIRSVLKVIAQDISLGLRPKVALITAGSYGITDYFL
jgi:hypothetical protein